MTVPVSELETVSISTACLACGADIDRPDGSCSRCGSTAADMRLLLRAATQAYTVARDAATRGDYTAASTAAQEAASLGLSGHPALERLRSLIARADAPVATETQADSYRTARAAALSGRFTEALPLLETIAPISPSARELYRLGQQGHRRQIRTRRQRTITGIGAGTVVIALAGKAFLPTTSKRATIVVTSSPIPTAAAPSPIPIPASSPKEMLLQDYPYPERLARRYFNDALYARRHGEYRNAARLAEAAAKTGKHTYIFPDALLLRAEIADTIREADAAEKWAEIAHAAPDSPYAPLGLLRAAECVRKRTGNSRAAQPYLVELFQRYSVSKEAKTARNRFGLSGRIEVRRR